jgi:DNA-directed RNA polymerase subunit RPC12/RpoP
MYRCWFCGRKNTVTWPETFRYVGAKKSHECPHCDFMVHCEVIEPYPHTRSPRVKITFDTPMWIPPDERTSP